MWPEAEAQTLTVKDPLRIFFGSKQASSQTYLHTESERLHENFWSFCISTSISVAIVKNV